MYNVRNYLLKNHVAPKWVVFIFDTIIGGAAILIANYLRFNLDYNAFKGQHIVDDLVLVLLTNALFFFIFRTYQGIIRFSGFAESVRTTSALFGSFLVLMLMNVLINVWGNPSLIPPSVLIINLLTSSFLMVGYRLAVKMLYRKSLANGKNQHVVIFGGEINGSQLKTTIEQASNNHFCVVAFIDDDQSYVGKTIDDTRIFGFHQMKEVMSNWDVKLMLFAKPDLDAEVKNKVVDFCLENDILVRNIPPVDQWIKGHLNITQLKEIHIEELLGRPAIKLRNHRVLDLVGSKRILITGAAGSIGSELARQAAVFNPALLMILDQNETGLYELEYELRNSFPQCNLCLFIGDVRDENTMETMFKRFRPEVVFHAAAYKHVPMMEYHPSEAVRNNVKGTRIMADLSIEHGVERFLLISTDKAINPTNVMGASKRIAEIYVQSLGNRQRKVVHLNGHSANGHNVNNITERRHTTKFITTRFGNVLGSNGSVLPRFRDQIAAGGPVTVTHPEIIRYFMTIPEACQLVLEAVTMGNGGEVFLFDMGVPVKIADLARKMIKLAGYVPGIDIEIRYSGLRPGEKLYEELLNKAELVIPTHHKKILIAKVVEYDYYTVNKSIDVLLDHAWQGKDEEVVRQMKRIVPEYISNNSVYQQFDEVVHPEIALSS